MRYVDGSSSLVPTPRPERQYPWQLPTDQSSPSRPPQYDRPIGPGTGAERPPQYQQPIGPGVGGQQYVVTPDGKVVVADPSTPAPASSSRWLTEYINNFYRANTTNEFAPTTANAAMSAYQTNPPTQMYKPFEMLPASEKNFWALMAANYDSNSNPETQYAKFAEIAMNQGAMTGVWANPMGIAMRHARDMGYDMRNVYVPGTRAGMAARRGTATYEAGAYDPQFEGFTNTIGPDSSNYYGGGGGGGGGGSSSVDLTNPTTARGLLTQAMQGALGREPSREEIRDFIQVLNKKQTNNPVTVSAEGDTVVRSGGVDPGVVAIDYVTAMPEYEEYRGSQYFETFMSSLAGGS